MSRPVPARRPLFDPWLDWEQLPDAIRERALDVLTALYLHVVDAPPIGEPTDPNPSGGQDTRSRGPAQHGATDR